MYSLTVQNKYGTKMTLTNDSRYYVVKVTGLTPAAANINTDALAVGDGSLFNSSRVSSRNIVITLQYRSGINVEEARLDLYKAFKTKQWVRVFYKTSTRDVYIDGYVETFEGDLFERGQMAAVSIICPDPFFKAVESTVTDFNAVISLLEFPVEFPESGIPFSEIRAYSEKSVVNGGDAESGVIIRCNFTGETENPAFYNLTTGEGLSVAFSFLRGDSLIIDTNQGSKSITLIREGVTINMLNYLVQGSAWFLLTIGDNVFTFTADDDGRENMDVVFTSTNQFEGV